jgi:hypothetical protein
MIKDKQKKAKKEPKLRLLRLPADLDEAVQKRAESQNRSVNSQIVFELSM